MLNIESFSSDSYMQVVDYEEFELNYDFINFKRCNITLIDTKLNAIN